MLRGELKKQARGALSARAQKREAMRMRVKTVTDAEAYAGRDKCVLRPGSCGEVVGILAAMRKAIACVEAHMAAFERIIERNKARRGGRGVQGTYGGGAPCTTPC